MNSLFPVQNPVWCSTGQEPADAEEDGRHAHRDHDWPAVMSDPREAYRSEEVRELFPSSFVTYCQLLKHLLFFLEQHQR